ncbi:MAG: WD40 repeat domain-containing protein, partial [Pirellula sp.]
ALVYLPESKRWLLGDSEGMIAVLPELVGTNSPDLGTLRWERMFEATQVLELDALPGKNAYIARGGAPGWFGVIRDFETGRELFRIDDCVSMGASPDGRWVAVGRRESNNVELVETETFKRIAVLSGHRSTVEQVAFTGDGRWLVSGAHDRTVRLWRTSDWGLEDRIIVPGSKISAIAISPDSRTLVVGDVAGRVSIWELETRRELIELRQSGLPVIRAEFSPDGRTLLLWTEGNRIDLYKAGDRL